MGRLVIRLGVIGFWIALIFAALYWPKWEFLHYDKNSINIFAWGDILEPSAIAAFEAETGIKVHVNYYSSNEELLVKLKATRGEGYDLIVPSDYAVELLVQEGLLKELDKTKLDFWNALNPRLLGHTFDPQNRYSIPFEWEIFGLGIDKNYFAGQTLSPSWKMLFDPAVVKYKITMMNDPIEALTFATFYLYDVVKPLKPAQVAEVKNLLIQQKNWVEAYAEFRADYFLATKNCPVVIASSSYIWRTMRNFKFVDFVVPKEGTFITIENLSIPKASDKEKLVYSFINFLYRPDTIAKHHNTFGFYPATSNAMHLLDLDPVTKQLILSTEEDFKKYHFFKTFMPEQEMRDLWVEIKSSR